MAVRLLLVDDDESIRTGLKMILETEDEFEIVGQAANGVEALELSEVLKPDVILMDIQMPEMDGFEATQKITEKYSGVEGPCVLMLTTFKRDEYVSRAKQVGASGFLLKRLPADELISGIHRCIDERRRDLRLM